MIYEDEPKPRDDVRGWVVYALGMAATTIATELARWAVEELKEASRPKKADGK